MDLVQWLIDFLRDFQDWGALQQFGLVVAILAPILLVVAWVKGSFRRGYQEITNENDKLKARFANTKETLNNVRRENVNLQNEAELLQARLPETLLGLVDQELRDGNYGPAIHILQRMFDDLSGSLEDCLLQLNELASAPTTEENSSIVAVDVGRYRQLSTLLREAREKAPPS